jgi:hypothetical protein
MKTSAFVLAIAIMAAGVMPSRAQGPIEELDYDHPEDALMAIQDLQTMVRVLALEHRLGGYADQCDLAVRDVENHAALYGVPERADLRRAWTTCDRAYGAVAPKEAAPPPADTGPAPSSVPQTGPTAGQPLDAPPDFFAKPGAGE